MTTCRECGCTDSAACLVAGVPCMWVEADLCSGCASVSQLLEAAGGLAWVLLVAAHVAGEREAWSEAAESYLTIADAPPPTANPLHKPPAGELLVDVEADWGAR